MTSDEKRLPYLRTMVKGRVEHADDATKNASWAGDVQFLLRLLDASQARLAEEQAQLKRLQDYVRTVEGYVTRAEAAEERTSALAAALTKYVYEHRWVSQWALGGFECQECNAIAETAEQVVHKPNCILAREALARAIPSPATLKR